MRWPWRKRVEPVPAPTVDVPFGNLVLSGAFSPNEVRRMLGFAEWMPLPYAIKRVLGDFIGWRDDWEWV